MRHWVHGLFCAAVLVTSSCSPSDTPAPPPSSTTTQTTSEGPEWARANLFDRPGLSWGVGGGDGDVSAVFGQPDTDYVIVTLRCSSNGQLSVEYYDSTLIPLSGYDARVRIGDHEVSTVSQTSERWEMESIVALNASFPPNPGLLDALADGKDFRMLFRPTGAGSEWVGLSLRGNSGTLTPFVAQCDAS